MAESPTRLDLTLDLLSSSGYIERHEFDCSDSEQLAGGLARCVLGSLYNHQFNVVSIETLTFDEKMKLIEEALRSMEECPYSIEACRIRKLDGESLFPVVRWLIDRKDENRRKVVVLNQLEKLRARISEEGGETKVKVLVSLMQSLQDLERQESEFRLYSKAKQSQLEDEVIDLTQKIASGCDGKSVSDGLSNSLTESVKELDSARKELGAMLRAVLAVKRQLGDMPSQSELIQYERRFSELYSHIQGKHQQTQKYYDTYNALLEIKELMLKETSLLNSISSQFQDAITSTAGRSKLIDSMEGIVKSSQQKLEKVQAGLEDQERVCHILKEKYTEAIAAQRNWMRAQKTRGFEGQQSSFVREEDL